MATAPYGEYVIGPSIFEPEPILSAGRNLTLYFLKPATAHLMSMKTNAE